MEHNEYLVTNKQENEITMEMSDFKRIIRSSLVHTAASQQPLNNMPIHNLSESNLNIETVCSLWAGKGKIYKASVNNQAGTCATFIIKNIAAPVGHHQQSLSDIRKANSYQVEANFYEKLATLLIDEFNLPIPRPSLVERDADGRIIICMSYIKHDNNPSFSDKHIEGVLSWLAKLHAAFWGKEKAEKIVNSVGLAPIGSYWYLDTRPDEYKKMPNRGWEGRLKMAARAIDKRLHHRDPLQCLIHGDAKSENILLSSRNIVAMCDFQYCGMAPPTVDLAYFFCTSTRISLIDCYIDYYYDTLLEHLPKDAIKPTKLQLVDSLDLAFCDFYRFMAGWGYWGSGGEDRVKAVLDRLDGGKLLKSEQDYHEALIREYG